MKLVIILALFAVASALPSPKWHEFKRKFNKTYSSTSEEAERFKVYLKNVQLIEQHNQQYENGLVKYKLAVNKFADLTRQEFKKMYLGYLGKKNEVFDSSVSLKDLPESVDWREKGVVTPVKDQGQCGSCWAFSAIASVESRDAQKTGKLVELSEQQLMDCSSKYGDMSCRGGLMDWAFQYIIDNKGVDTESSYPYEGIDDNCRFKPTDVGGSISGYVNISQGDENSLKSAVANGVVSVAIEADTLPFQFYSSGIYQSQCNTPAQLDHGVAIVGYGTENGTDFWIVKNSWGDSWGENGYVRMERGINLCGIADAPSFPVY